MKYELTLIKYRTDDDEFEFYEKITSDELLHLLSQFVLIIGKVSKLEQEKLRVKVDSLKYTMKHHKIEDDDIPF